LYSELPEWNFQGRRVCGTDPTPDFVLSWAYKATVCSSPTGISDIDEINSSCRDIDGNIVAV